MAGDTRRVIIHIESKIKKEKPVPATKVAEIFQRLQNVLYYIVDDLEGNPTRGRGDFPNSVKERCELVITKMIIGSIETELTISDLQSCLPGEETFGEKAISIADKIVQAVSEEADVGSMISGFIKNERRINRIFSEFDFLWPDSQSNYNIGLNFRRTQKNFLDPAHKHIIRDLLSKPPEKTEKSAIGRLMEIRVDQKRSFQIDTSDGPVTCLYTPELEDKIVENIGRLIRVRGIMALEKSGKYTMSLEDDKSIEALRYMPLPNIKIRGRSLYLREPLDLDILYEDDQYMVSNDKLHLMAVGPNLKDAIKGINEEIEILWEDYVEASLDELSEDAVEFRRRMISSLEKA
jgi:hypothetical protein